MRFHTYIFFKLTNTLNKKIEKNYRYDVFRGIKCNSSKSVSFFIPYKRLVPEALIIHY